MLLVMIWGRGWTKRGFGFVVEFELQAGGDWS